MMLQKKFTQEIFLKEISKEKTTRLQDRETTRQKDNTTIKSTVVL